MVDRVVIDTGPLIALAHAGALDLAPRLGLEYLAPLEVRDEIAAGMAAGHDPVLTEFVRFVPLRAALPALATSQLDRGEAAVIQLALDERIGLVCIDERRARRAAAAVGLRVVGTSASSLERRRSDSSRRSGPT